MTTSTYDATEARCPICQKPTIAVPEYGWFDPSRDHQVSTHIRLRCTTSAQHRGCSH